MNKRLVLIAAVSLSVAAACALLAVVTSATGWGDGDYRAWAATTRRCATMPWAKKAADPRTVDLEWSGSDVVKIKIPARVHYQPGPKPQGRENGIVMLADAVESASRALPDPSPGSLRKLVRDLLMKRLLDGQYGLLEVKVQGIRAVARSINIRSPDFLASTVSGGDKSAASTTPVNSACETSPKRPNATSFTSLNGSSPARMSKIWLAKLSDVPGGVFAISFPLRSFSWEISGFAQS